MCRFAKIVTIFFTLYMFMGQMLDTPFTKDAYGKPIYTNVVDSSLTNALASLGVFQLRNLKITGKGVTIVVHDHFPHSISSDGSRNLFHGEIVQTYAQKVAPDANVLSVDLERGLPGEEKYTNYKSLRPDFIKKYNVRIVNRSNGLEINRLYQGRLAQLLMQPLLQLTRMGVVVVVSAGNNSSLLGTEPYGKALFELARSVNEDEDNPGAIIVVGSGVPPLEKKYAYRPTQHPILSNYSAMAGLLRDYYVYVPVSTTVELSRTDDFSQITGTSFSAPVVSGMLALLMEAFPNATGKQIARMILSSAVCPRVITEMVKQKLERATDLSPADIKQLYPEDIYGRGEANVWRAYEKGRLTKNPELDLLNNANDQIIESTMYDVFADMFYRKLEETPNQAPPPVGVINYLHANYPIANYQFPLFYRNSMQARPYAEVALKFIFEVIEGYRKHRVDDDKPMPVLYEMIRLYHTLYPHSYEAGQSMEREKQLLEEAMQRQLEMW